VKLEQQLATGHLGEMALQNLGSIKMAQTTIGQNWNSNFVVKAYIASRGASNKPMGPLWTPLSPSLLVSIIFMIPMFDLTPHTSMVVPFLGPTKAHYLKDIGKQPHLQGTLQTNHFNWATLQPSNKSITLVSIRWWFDGGHFGDLFTNNINFKTKV
jgi:hypothetical protein